MRRSAAILLAVGFTVLMFFDGSLLAQNRSSLTGTWDGTFFAFTSAGAPSPIVGGLGKLKLQLKQQGKRFTGTGSFCEPAPCTPPSTPSMNVSGFFVGGNENGFFMQTVGLDLVGSCAPEVGSATGMLTEDGSSFTILISGRDEDCVLEAATVTFDKQP